MKKIATLLMLLLMSNSPTKNNQAAVKLTPGLWNLSISYTKMQMAGIPEDKLRSHLGPQPSQKICITQEMSDAGYLSSGFPVLDGCLLSRKIGKNGKLSSRMSCANGNRITTALGTIKPNRIEMDARLEQFGSDWQKFDTKITAMRIGDCPA